MELTPDQVPFLDEITDLQEYYLSKNGIIHKIAIGKNKEEIIINSKKYLIKLNSMDLSLLIGIEFNILNKAYEYIINLFEENKIIIEEIKFNDEIKLKILDKKIEFILKYNIMNKNLILNEIYNLKKDINLLKEERTKLKNEINELRKYHFNQNPKNIELSSDIVKDSYAYDNSDNSFTIFKAINDILYLIYSNENKSIICYDVENNKKIKEIISNHNEYITNFRHYLDEINNRDLIISISCDDNNLKLWNINKWECILDLKNINYNGFLYSACFLTDNNIIFLATSNCNWRGKSESIKIYDIKGNKLNEIENSDESTLFLDTYYDKSNLKTYILTGNRGYIKTYDYNSNKLYHKYCGNDNNNNSHLSIIIQNIDDITKIIESCNDGNIRIWNFHTGTLLITINVSIKFLRGICLWDKYHIFVACFDNTIKLIEMEKGLIIKSLCGHKNYVLTLKKVFLSNHGFCLISQGYKDNDIKLWINKEK